MLLTVSVLVERQASYKDYLRGAIFRFDPASHLSAGMAKTFGSFGAHAIPKVGNSSLALRSGEKVDQLNDLYGIESALKSRAAPYYQGISVAIILASAGLAGFLLRDLCCKFCLLFTVPATIGFVAVGSRCIICGTSQTVLSSIVPVVGLFLMAALLALMSNGFAAKWKTPVVLFLSVSPLVQAALLMAEPKFCWACITSGTCLMCMAYGLDASRDPGADQILLLPGYKPLTILCLATALRSGLAAGGVWAYPTSNHDRPGNLIGLPLHQFVSGTRQAAGLYMISGAQCSACAAARAGMPAAKIHAKEIPVCTSFSQQPCFDPRTFSVGTPTFIGVGKTDRILWQFVGWPPDQKALAEWEVLEAKEKDNKD